MTREKTSWRRITGEAVLIISSVFVAIALESAWQERQNFLAAQGALGQMLEELRQDRADLDEVLDEQRSLDSTYRRVISWLSDPESLSEQEFGEAMVFLSYSNRTMYPRRSAWTTMVASGQLQLLNNAELVTKLGDLHENLYLRLITNGNAYDQDLFTTMRESVPRVWDYNEYRFLTLDATEIARLRGELKFIHYTWNQWYLELLTEEYGTVLDELIADVDAYLVSHQY
jgi:hypothetical protein